MKQGVNLAKQALKKKIILAVAPFVLGFFCIILVIIIVASPVLAAKEAVDSALNSTGTFFEKLGNFFSGYGYNSDDEAFFELLADEDLSCEQAKIVTATIMYYYQTVPTSEMELGEVPEETNNAGETVDIYDENIFPYGKILPDLKKLVKKVKKGNSTYEEYVKDTFLDKEPYSELLNGFTDTDKRKDQIYKEMEQIATSVECPNRSSNSSSGAKCTFNVEDTEASNIKVQLLNCKTSEPINEEPIDFEKYVLGVVYQEVGTTTDEAVKAQAIAARSYALSRGKAMGYASGIGKLENNGDDWILYLRSCTADQVYCDPDNGCHSQAVGGEMNYADDATVYSGYDASAVWSREAMPEDSKLRDLVAETNGMVLVDENDDIVYTPFTSTEQNAWTAMANSGSDYYEILKKQYSSAKSIESNCVLTGASGDFSSWKQYDPQWGNLAVGNNTMSNIGCLVTSVAIQIARSGTELLVDDFDPGVFVTTISKHNGIGQTGAFLNNSSSWSSLAPNFKYVGRVSLTGSRQTIANQINEQLEKNCYPVIQVNGPLGEHHVAANYVDGDDVYVIEPAQWAEKLWVDKTPVAMNIYCKND